MQVAGALHLPCRVLSRQTSSYHNTRAAFGTGFQRCPYPGHCAIRLPARVTARGTSDDTAAHHGLEAQPNPSSSVAHASSAQGAAAAEEPATSAAPSKSSTSSPASSTSTSATAASSPPDATGQQENLQLAKTGRPADWGAPHTSADWSDDSTDGHTSQQPGVYFLAAVILGLSVVTWQVTRWVSHTHARQGFFWQQRGTTPTAVVAPARPILRRRNMGDAEDNQQSTSGALQSTRGLGGRTQSSGLEQAAAAAAVAAATPDSSIQGPKEGHPAKADHAATASEATPSQQQPARTVEQEGGPTSSAQQPVEGSLQGAATESRVAGDEAEAASQPAGPIADAEEHSRSGGESLNTAPTQQQAAPEAQGETSAAQPTARQAPPPVEHAAAAGGAVTAIPETSNRFFPYSHPWHSSSGPGSDTLPPAPAATTTGLPAFSTSPAPKVLPAPVPPISKAVHPAALDMLPEDDNLSSLRERAAIALKAAAAAGEASQRAASYAAAAASAASRAAEAAERAAAAATEAQSGLESASEAAIAACEQRVARATSAAHDAETRAAGAAAVATSYEDVGNTQAQIAERAAKVGRPSPKSQPSALLSGLQHIIRNAVDGVLGERHGTSSN